MRSLIRAVSRYAVKGLRPTASPPAPKQILLAYVPAGDEERMLSEFEFFVFPIRLSLLAAYDASGRQNRHNRDLAVRYLVSSLQIADREFMAVKSRLSSPSDKSPSSCPRGTSTCLTRSV